MNNNNNNNNSIQLRDEEEGDDDDDDTTTHQNFPFPLTTIMSQDHIPRRDNNTHEITSTSTQQCGGGGDDKPFCSGSDQSKEEPNMVQYLKGNDEDHEDDAVILKLSSYKECLRNHAASIGGYAVDGCGEFMPSSPNGNKAESFKCSACGCHRNFHRKKTRKGKNVKSTTPHAAAADYPLHSHIEPPSAKGSRPSKTQHGTMKWSPEVELSAGSSDQAGDRHYGINVPNSTTIISGEKRGMMKKRFRTKFTNEQKEKMLRFAERAEWRIQKLDESEVQRFCQEVGIKRRVLKVWMHNNKHNYVKKTIIAN